jgi:bacterioferritin
MKRDKSIELLNRAIADELSAVHQYMFLHFHCDDQGYDLLSTLFKRTAIAKNGATNHRALCCQIA